MSYQKRYRLRPKLKAKPQNGVYTDEGKNREVLTISWERRPDSDSVSNYSAVVIGINPSIANDVKSDNTLTRLARFLDIYGFTEFKMLNIFSSYSTQPTGIRKNTQTDFSNFKNDLESTNIIILAWGTNNNDYREEKSKILEFLKSKNLMDKVFGISSNEMHYETRHPSRMSYDYYLVKQSADNSNLQNT